MLQQSAKWAERRHSLQMRILWRAFNKADVQTVQQRSPLRLYQRSATGKSTKRKGIHREDTVIRAPVQAPTFERRSASADRKTER